MRAIVGFSLRRRKVDGNVVLLPFSLCTEIMAPFNSRYLRVRPSESRTLKLPHAT